MKLQPVILSGGSGSRLWPLSRDLHPKQLQKLIGEHTMLQATALRVNDPARFLPPIIVANEAHRFIVAEQLQEVGIRPADIILEPIGHNTAPAVTAAALRSLETETAPVLLILAADHAITDPDGFHTAVATAASASAAGNWIIAFGIEPDRAHTGYGYIQRGAEVAPGAFAIARFIEKPPEPEAIRMIADGQHLWNGGFFLAPAALLLEEMALYAPQNMEATRQAVATGKRDIDFLRLNQEAFCNQPPLSLDHAVMEKTKRAVVVPVRCGWSDVGSWDALWDIASRDAAGNVTIGDVLVEDTRNSYVRSDGVLTTVVGLSDMLVVATDDALLVARRGQGQDVRRVVDRLKAKGRSEAICHSRVYRPWGFYQTLNRGERFQVKQLTVYPGRQLSLQRHYHRAEHWVVVHGTAQVTRGEETLLLSENEGIFIPLAALHRLANPGRVLLNLIEVQIGPYLGEDDIVRYDEVLAVPIDTPPS